MNRKIKNIIMIFICVLSIGSMVLTIWIGKNSVINSNVVWMSNIKAFTDLNFIRYLDAVFLSMMFQQGLIYFITESLGSLCFPEIVMKAPDITGFFTGISGQICIIKSLKIHKPSHNSHYQILNLWSLRTNAIAIASKTKI